MPAAVSPTGPDQSFPVFSGQTAADAVDAAIGVGLLEI